MLRKSLIIIALVLIADQVLKVYIKTHYTLGEMHTLFGSWSHILFIENEGMAFGWKFFGKHGKLFLSIFRILAAAGIFYYLLILIRKNAKPGMVFAFSLIFAGAMGNIFDSVFYGVVFTESTFSQPATFAPGNGYAPLLFGKVVDMFYFPIINGYYPEWQIIPAGLRGQHFLFFRPIFNLADSAITTGVFILLIFQRRFFNSGGIATVDGAEGNKAPTMEADSQSETHDTGPASDAEAADYHIPATEPDPMRETATETAPDTKPEVSESIPTKGCCGCGGLDHQHDDKRSV